MLPLNLSSADATRDHRSWNVDAPYEHVRDTIDLSALAGPARSRLKRTIDILGAMVLLIALTPVLVALALLVRSDGGPVLFRQRRIGAGGRPFMCLKYRTMRTDAEAQLQQLLARDPEARASWESDFKLRVDPRITRFGGLMRRTSLDELPQLFNVLKGDMSLVGPRPIVAAEVVRYGVAMREYLNCRPGVTGLWQVSGRNDVDYKTRVKLDQTYVRNWSIVADVGILFRTVRVVLLRSGAY
jgi:Undecaprenyl-phosphate galactose phosphotransferase WbaP